ncbi:TadG family pilus assembly protein [Pseudooceanicola nanhaiensis]|uniref:TadG family pilus assembly protein n=1 Tax=Pseudooceanicola nanhaiensis TaxID=375761 RepID=UPI004057E3C4
MRAALRAARRRARDFARSERGDVNLLMLYVLLGMFAVGGVVLDLSNRHRVLAMLQATADVSATSGAVRLAKPRHDQLPRDAARATARASLDETHLDGAWTEAGFELGNMPETGEITFTPGGLFPNAVRVTLKRTKANNNPEPTMLLRVLGIGSFDLEATSLARIRRQNLLPCTDPLLSLKTRVDVGETDLYAGICLKARATASYGIGETWMTLQAAEFVDGLLARVAGLDTGTSPSTDSLSTDGLLNLVGFGETPLTDTTWLARNLSADIVSLARAAPNVLEAALFSTYELRAGESYRVRCDPQEVLRIEGPRRLRNVALYSDCPIEFDADVTVEMALILSNLSALLGDPGPFALSDRFALDTSADCRPGDGARIFLFLDTKVAAGIPALVDPVSPFGAYLQTTWYEAGGLVTLAQSTLAPLLITLSDALTLTGEALGLAKVCLQPRIMLQSDTVQLK